MFGKKKIPISMTDADTGRQYETEAEPGSPEFAAWVKVQFDAAMGDVRKAVGEKNWNELCTVMFSCMYDNDEGIAQCIDGNNDKLLLLMAVAIHSMIDAEIAKQKFNPQKMGGNQIGARLIQMLASYVNQLDRDIPSTILHTP